MWNAISNEAIIFACMAAGGVLLGIIFDIMRSIRTVFNGGKLLTHITDTMFWIMSGTIIIYLLIKLNNGIMRFYEFLGLTLGCIIYFLTVGIYIKLFFIVFFKFSRKFIVFILKILLTPIKFLYKILLGLFIGVHRLLNCKKEVKNESGNEQKNQKT